MWQQMMVAVICLVVNAQASEATTGPKQSVTAPTAERLDGVQSFWKDCLHKDALGEVMILGPSRKDNSLPPGTLRARVKDGSGTVDLDIDPATGRIFTYARLEWTSEPGTEGRTHKEAIPEGTAWERALSVLRYFGLSTECREYEITLTDYGTMRERDDLYGAFWEVRQTLKHEGLPCVGSYVSVGISANSGEIVMVLYSPPVVPRVQHAVKVTETEAVRTADKWLKGTEFFRDMPFKVGSTPEVKVEEVVARPSNPHLNPDGRGVYPDTGETYFCWEVPYQYHEDNHSRTRRLWVRVDNGDVIGGY